MKTLTELRQWNAAHAKAGAITYGQSRLDISDEWISTAIARATTRT